MKILKEIIVPYQIEQHVLDLVEIWLNIDAERINQDISTIRLKELKEQFNTILDNMRYH